MSGITPLIDTLLHQVLGRRVDTPVIKDQPLPVSATASTDAIQPARSDSRLHQQGGERVAAMPSGAGHEGVSQPPVAPGLAKVPSAQLHLSHTATEIADILSRFPATQSPSIRPLLALMAHPIEKPDMLAAALSQSVRESGVFYESHLLRWMSGQYPRASLMREPQAWLSLTFRPFTPTSLLTSYGFPFTASDGRAAHRPGASPGAMTGAMTGSNASAQSTLSANAGRGGDVLTASMVSDRGLPAVARSGAAGEWAPSVRGTAEESSSLSMTRAHQLSQSPSDTLQSLVRQQLELIAAPNLRWEGQLWPGVPMTMILTELPRESVHDDAGDSPDRSEQEEGASDWRAEVQVRLPSLGVIDIIFVTRRNAALQVEVKPAEETTRVQLRQELIPMRERLASLGMSVELIVGESEHE